MICPKCKKVEMTRAGKVRQGKQILQRWMCSKLAGCGHVCRRPIEINKGGK